MLRPPPQTPLQLFFYFLNIIVSKNIYLYPSITHSSNRSRYLFVCLSDALSSPSFFFTNMFNDDPKNVYTCIHPSLINRSIYLFLCLFDSLSFMQCSRFCPPNAMRGRCCALPPNPPPAFFLFFKHHRIQKMYTCIPPSLIQVIALGISLFVYRTLCRPPVLFFKNMFNDDPKNVYLYPSITH